MFVIRKIRNLKLVLISFFWTQYSYLVCKAWGVQIEKKCIFRGRVIFNVKPDSIIRIGFNNRFNSKVNGNNLIGINRPCIIATHTKRAEIHIGNSCGFSGTVIGAFNKVTLGNDIKCGANTLITDSDWHTDDPRSGEAKPIVIEDNVWLGVGVIVLKGVTIGKNSVIGAGSIVTKDIPANVIAAGNPCKVIRQL